MRKILRGILLFEILHFLLFTTFFSLQAKNSDSLVYVWDFTSQDSTMDDIVDKLTVEFEEALIKKGCYVVLERRKYDRLISQKDNERSILNIEGISSTTLDSLKFYKAALVIFGEVYDDIESGEIKVTVSFQAFNGEKIKQQSILFRRGLRIDAKSREKEMEKLVEEICSEESALKLEKEENLIVRGLIYCASGENPENNRPISEECVVVVPIEYPDSSVINSDDGKFHIKLPYNISLLDKVLPLKFQSNNKSVATSKPFISSERVKMEGKNRIFEISNSVLIKRGCDSLGVGIDCVEELQHLKSPENITEKSGFLENGNNKWLLIGAITSASILAYTTILTKVVEADTTIIDTLDILSVNYPAQLGDIITLTYSTLRTNTGLNFAPIKNFEKSPFLNSSAIVFSDFHNFHSNTDFSKFLEFSGSTKILKNFALGLGINIVSQNEKSVATLETGQIIEENFVSRAILGLISFSYKLSEIASIAISPKYINQRTDIPIDVIRTREFTNGNLVSETFSYRTNSINEAYFDLDVSSTFNLYPGFRLGINIFNALSTKIKTQGGDFTTIRAFGFGTSYKRKRNVIGADVLITEGYKPFIAIGTSYILNNAFDVNMSLANRYDFVQLGFSAKLTNFRINYSYNLDDRFNGSHLFGLNLSI